MNTTRLTLPIAVLVVAAGNPIFLPSANAAHADPLLTAGRHFELVNATFDSVTAVAVAPAGQEKFHDLVLGAPLQGGLTSTTVDIPAGGCLRDLRVTFRDGHEQHFQRLNVCRISGLRLAPRGGRQPRREGLPPASTSVRHAHEP